MALFDGEFERDVIEALIDVRPTTILGVPALWNLLFCQFQDRCASVSATRALREVSTMFGERLTVVSSGTAPLSFAVADFMRQAFGNRYIGEGYGTSETGLITLNGVIQEGVEVRLRDVPELGFSTKDLPHPRGEVLVRTESMAKYFSDDERTAAAYTTDGFFITGDIGVMQFSDTGERLLDIIDRVGSVFKLQNGEFVCPARLEDVYMSCPSIQDIFVFGKPAWSGLVAVVRPTAGTDAGEAAVREELDLCGRNHKLAFHERILAFGLETETDWTYSNDFCTPSLKHVRRAFLGYYGSRLEALYEEVRSEDSWEAFVRRWFGVDSDHQVLWHNGNADSVSAVQVASKLQAEYGLPNVLAALLRSDASLSGLRELASRDDSSLLTARKDAAMHLDFEKEEPVRKSPLSESRVVLLTGATGFLGPYLVREILSKIPGSQVLCLVRNGEPDSSRSARIVERRCHQRLVSYLQKIVPADYLHSRVQVLVGDLADNDLGLTPQEYATLAEKVSLVVHSGASVDWLRDYSTLRSTNVAGTASILRLRKPVLYISSGVVSGAGRDDPADDRFDPATLSQASGYALTKGVAEHLCHRVAKERQATKIVVVRVGTVTAEANEDRPHTSGRDSGDFVTRLVKTVQRTGTIPDSKIQLEMIAVDYVAKAVIELFVHSESSRLFTLSNPSSLSFAQIGRALQKNKTILGTGPVLESVADFLKRVRENPATPLFPLLSILEDNDWWEENEGAWQDPETVAALPLYLRQPPAVTAEYIWKLFSGQE